MAYRLNQEKVKWIIREVGKGDLTRAQIAWAQSISVSRVNQLWSQYVKTGEAPVLRRPGRPPRPIEAWELHVVRQAHEDYRVGACLLEGRIEEDYGLHIGHNRIHRVMLHLGLAREEMRKKRRRKWVRYEKAHSMELWHTDWKWLAELDRWLIAYEDDASRFVVGYETFQGISTRSSLRVLEEAISAYRMPDAVLTDRGSEFYASDYEGRPRGPSAFTQHLQDRGIRHIVGRVNHPQTNGKVERLYRTVEEKLPVFQGDLDALMEWYNAVKPHMSLSRDGRRYDTPAEAFWYKMAPERLLGHSDGWLWKVDP